jgi:hypothetical protein
VRYQKSRKLGAAHSQTDFKTGDAWLRNLEHSRADPILIADANFVISQAINREILSKLTVFEPFPIENLVPIMIGRYLIHQYRSHLSPVPNDVRDRISIKPKTTSLYRPALWAFPYG